MVRLQWEKIELKIYVPSENQIHAWWEFQRKTLEATLPDERVLTSIIADIAVGASVLGDPKEIAITRALGLYRDVLERKIAAIEKRLRELEGD